MEIKRGTVVKNKYEILKQVGEGGTSTVFLAKDLVKNIDIVLKISKSKSDAKVQSLDKRFLLEAQILLKFNNPHIVKVYEYFIWEGRYVIVMEHLSGKTLKDIMKINGRIKPRKAVLLTLQILEALKDLHKEGIIHRDLKPQNVIVGYDNKLRLMDFGIVQASLEQDITKTGNVIGTIEYMAPEVLKHQKATPQSEIYSLGICLYYMVTGTMPFRGTDMIQIAKKHINEDAIPPIKLTPEVSELLSEIILKMLKKDSFDRYKTSEEMIQVLTKFLEIDKKEIYDVDIAREQLLLTSSKSTMEKSGKKLFKLFNKK